MRRLHLIEFEDMPWFPAWIRRYLQDILEFMAGAGAMAYVGFARRLKRAMQESGQTRIVDLCSGSSGPVKVILNAMDKEGFAATAVLTDLFPNVTAFERVKGESGDRIDFVGAPVDATNVPESLTGFRLLCNAFHHFPSSMARQILEDAYRKKRGIAVIEMVGRSIPAVLSLTIAVLLTFLITPLLKPFSLRRIVFTYVIPLVPFFVIWDGVVSCLRVYAPWEMNELIQGLESPDYDWETGRMKLGNSPAYVTYLVGTPRI